MQYVAKIYFISNFSVFIYFLGNIMVGPITVQKPGKLPPDFEEFVSNSGGHGFIMVSFGSYVESVLDKDKLNMLATAFGKLRQKVLWRLKGDYVTILNPERASTLEQHYNTYFN